MTGFDYVIAGGGTAGCVLAARLSEDADVRVLLLEAGGPDRHPLIHVPAGFARMTGGPFTWGLSTVPQVHADNRRIPYAQARVLGGGSSINAQVFTRGHPADYDRWAGQEGAPGWSFAEVQPLFLRAEGNSGMSGPWHGTDGPLGVSSNTRPEAVTRAFVAACREAGMPACEDFNGPAQMGAGVYQTSTRGGRRSSAATAYLAPARRRPNLVVETGCLVTRIVVESGRAVEVVYRQRGQQMTARAEAEVIVTAGAIGSPKLLMLSGIGPADHLASVGIDPVHDLPGVGANLTDHYGVDIVAELKDPISLDRFRPAHRMALAGLRYALTRGGPAASNIVEGGAFWARDPAADVPEMQFHFLAAAGAEEGVPGPASGAGITLNSYAARPFSRGTVRLASADPAAPPLVDPAFLSDPRDVELAADALELCLEIFAQPSLARLIRGMHLPDAPPGTRAERVAYLRRAGRTSYHPASSCRMGQDARAVVDPAVRVHGLSGLRVCDSSVMPSLIGSNTNAATVMIAEKAADLIRGNR